MQSISSIRWTERRKRLTAVLSIISRFNKEKVTPRTPGESLQRKTNDDRRRGIVAYESLAFANKNHR